MDRDAVCVLLPTYNEAETVGDVVRDFRDHGFSNVLVIDGDSDDGTRERAVEAGARVAVQSRTGKGQAIREAVSEHIDAEYVLMADADGTYRAADADDMLAPLFDGSAEHVIGDRFADMEAGAMTGFNKVGNAVFNWLFRNIHGEDFADILSGYRAFTRESFERLQLSADGFGIETELSVECARHGVDTTVVPITYLPRPDGSNTNLHPVRDGGIILMALYRQAKTSNPLFYFGSAGVLSGAVGVAVAGYVAYDWFANGVSHEVLAIAAGIALIFGVQLVMFGVLSDLLVTLHRETLDRLEDKE
ncbi:S-layer glycoprotein N-glycosyltransferase AglJ [Halobaculum sp. P14]|uniref:S-layer glycoprotein N-glycosyltransferase AglJ n=1 Tax=Halobaculum sp. P14 TaxID=3421638 RepID=UPI003EBE12BB